MTQRGALIFANAGGAFLLLLFGVAYFLPPTLKWLALAVLGSRLLTLVYALGVMGGLFNFFSPRLRRFKVSSCFGLLSDVIAVVFFSLVGRNVGGLLKPVCYLAALSLAILALIKLINTPPDLAAGEKQDAEKSIDGLES
jgi:hypothetical protein